MDHEITPAISHDAMQTIERFVEEFSFEKKALLLGEISHYIETNGMGASWAMQSTIALLYARLQDTIDPHENKQAFNRCSMFISEYLEKGGYDPYK